MHLTLVNIDENVTHKDCDILSWLLCDLNDI
jgi:hypothetical protein